MPKIAKPLPVLTDDQKKIIEANWQLEIGDLTRLTFGNPALDRRSVECKAVKQYLAQINRVAPPSLSGQTETIRLKPEQCEYVQANYKNATPLEMACALFNNPHLLISSPECRATTDFCRQLDPSFRKDEEVVVNEYEPPKNQKQLIDKVNRYAINPRHDGQPIYDSDKLSSQDKKQIQALLWYMQTPTFRVEASKHNRKLDRELFESTFIRLVWNKADLLAEEYQQYVMATSETIKQMQIERMATKLDERVNTMLENPGAALKMADVELLNSVREKSNASMAKIAAFIKALVGERAKRQEAKIAGTASLHNLVSAWAKEDERRKIIQMNARKEKAALKQEVQRMSDMDGLKAEIFGINRDDIVR